jgi:hypothetical protein
MATVLGDFERERGTKPDTPTRARGKVVTLSPKNCLLRAVGLTSGVEMSHATLDAIVLLLEHAAAYRMAHAVLIHQPQPVRWA